MTQLYRINIESLKQRDDVSIDILIGEWKLLETQHRSMILTDQLSEDDVRHITPAHVKGFGCLYRKNSINYVWRGKFVYAPVRERLIKAWENDELEGDLLLYKRGSGSRCRNNSCYPMRMTNGRYAIVLGGITGLLRYCREEHDIRINEDYWFNAFEMWASEHLVDFTNRSLDTHYRTRAQYVWLLEQFISDDDFIYACENYADEFPRTAYCVWQDGEIKRWMRFGQNVHPKI